MTGSLEWEAATSGEWAAGRGQARETWQASRNETRPFLERPDYSKYLKLGKGTCGKPFVLCRQAMNNKCHQIMGYLASTPQPTFGSHRYS